MAVRCVATSTRATPPVASNGAGVLAFRGRTRGRTDANPRPRRPAIGIGDLAIANMRSYRLADVRFLGTPRRRTRPRVVGSGRGLPARGAGDCRGATARLAVRGLRCRRGGTGGRLGAGASGMDRGPRAVGHRGPDAARPLTAVRPTPTHLRSSPQAAPVVPRIPASARYPLRPEVSLLACRQ